MFIFIELPPYTLPIALHKDGNDNTALKSVHGTK